LLNKEINISPIIVIYQKYKYVHTMKIKVLFLTAALVASSSISLHSQEAKTYKHPIRDFSFDASGKWKQNNSHTDKMIYEMVNPEHDIHVMLWYNGGTESTCAHYLVKMADMKGLECEEPQKRTYGEKEIWVLDGLDKQHKPAERRIMAAMSYDKPYGLDAPERSQGKSYNAMHIAQIWCPADRYEENKEMIDGIIASLKLDEQ
jgi:hypothetical protein